MTGKSFLAYYETNSTCRDVTDKEISTHLKIVAAALNYSQQKGIATECHSLCSGGANALALEGYSDQEIKNGALTWGHIQRIYL